jgi:RNA polymerase sigma factor (sigma-70 family)
VVVRSTSKLKNQPDFAITTSEVLLRPEVQRIVHFEARRATSYLRRFGLDVEDLSQEFSLDLLSRLANYDKDRGTLSEFVRRVCRHRSLQILESNRAQKRSGGEAPRSLAAPVGSDKPVELSDLISDDQFAQRLGRRSRPAAELLDLRMDLESIVTQMPSEYSVMAEALANGDSRNDVARRSGTSRSTIHRRTRRLRQVLYAVGLHRYLETTAA